MSLRRRAVAPTPRDPAAEHAGDRRRDLLANPGLAGILAREIVSLTGSQMTWVAIPWFVLTTTGSPTRMTIVLAFEAVAVAIGGFFGGGAAARVGPRRTMLVSDGARAPLIASIPILHVGDLLSFPLLVALVFAVGLFATPSFAAKSALLPDLVGEHDARLGEANTMLQTANRLTSMVGPPLAGVLIGVFGATGVLLIDAATFVAGFVLVGTLVRVAGHGDANADERGLRAVVRFLRDDPLLRPWTIALVLGDVMWIVLFATVPVLVLARFGDEPTILGWILAGFGIGAVAGGLIALRILRSVDHLLLTSVGEIGMAIPLWILLVHAPPLVLVGALAAAGFANGLVNGALHTIVQLRTPRHLRSRVYSAVIAATSVLGPLGLVAAGPALERYGVDATLGVVIAGLTSTVGVFAWSGLRFRAARGGTRAA